MSAIHAFLNHLIDYAGLFPPAQLPLPAAVQEYVKHRGEAEAWMLGRFICPAGKLKELASLRDQLRETRPFVVSALGRGGAGSDFEANLAQDLADVAAFQKAEHWATIDQLETKIPGFLSPQSTSIVSEAKLSLACEVGLASNWQQTVAELVRNSGSEERDSRRIPLRGIAFKLRCGGVEAAAFPSVEQVAAVLVSCRAAGLPLKFTAGLHHPVRHYNASVQTKMHGFLNLFGAGILGAVHDLPEATVGQIVAEEDATAFGLNVERLRWRNYAATAEQIRQARASVVLSYGSCSFDEPRDDLRSLGILS